MDSHRTPSIVELKVLQKQLQDRLNSSLTESQKRFILAQCMINNSSDYKIVYQSLSTLQPLNLVEPNGSLKKSSQPIIEEPIANRYEEECREDRRSLNSNMACSYDTSTKNPTNSAKGNTNGTTHSNQVQSYLPSVFSPSRHPASSRDDLLIIPNPLEREISTNPFLLKPLDTNSLERDAKLQDSLLLQYDNKRKPINSTDPSKSIEAPSKRLSMERPHEDDQRRDNVFHYNSDLDEQKEREMVIEKQEVNDAAPPGVNGSETNTTESLSQQPGRGVPLPDGPVNANEYCFSDDESRDSLMSHTVKTASACDEMLSVYSAGSSMYVWNSEKARRTDISNTSTEVNDQGSRKEAMEAIPEVEGNHSTSSSLRENGVPTGNDEEDSVLSLDDSSSASNEFDIEEIIRELNEEIRKTKEKKRKLSNK